MELMSLACSVFVVIITYYIYKWYYKTTNYWRQRDVPYEKSIPVLGFFIELFVHKKSVFELILELYNNLEGKPFGGYIHLFSPALIIRDPDLINQVLVKDFTYFEDRVLESKSDDLFKNGLPNLTGERWRNARHKLTPSFTSSKLKIMFNPIKECSDSLIDYLSNKEGKEIEARELMQKFVLSVVSSVAFGLKIDTLNNLDKTSNDFFKFSSKVFTPSAPGLIRLLFNSAPILSKLIKVSIVDNEADTFFKKLVNDAIKLRENTGKKRNDFLQLMLEQKKKDEIMDNTRFEALRDINSNEHCPQDKELLEQLKYMEGTSNIGSENKLFTDDFMVAQSFIFISAGSESTSAILSFVLFELAANPDSQRKLQNEIDSVVSTYEFSHDSIKKMVYMEQFINETMRLHPSTSTLFRFCTKDYRIPQTNVVIEKGTRITIPVIALHKDPQYFTDPEKFNPDRFQDMHLISKGVFLPFGYGPRMCIAMRLAMLEMKIFLTVLLSNYNLIMNKKTSLPIKLTRTSVTPHVEGGMWLNFQKRR